MRGDGDNDPVSEFIGNFELAVSDHLVNYPQNKFNNAFILFSVHCKAHYTVH